MLQDGMPVELVAKYSKLSTEEINKLKDLLEGIKTEEAKNLTIYTGKINGHDVILAKSGVGKVCATLNTQYIIDKYSPETIINTGVAGGIGKDLSIGDVVIGENLIQHDFDATALGYAKGYMCNGINPDKPTVFFSDKKLVDFAEQLLKSNLKNSNVHRGRIATGDMFVGTVEKKQEIGQIFGAIAAEMEGCAIAQTSNANNIPSKNYKIYMLTDGTASYSFFNEMFDIGIVISISFSRTNSNNSFVLSSLISTPVANPSTISQEGAI